MKELKPTTAREKYMRMVIAKLDYAERGIKMVEHAEIVQHKKRVARMSDYMFSIDANHYDFSVIVTNFGPRLRCYGQQSTCYGFPIIAGPKPFPI